MPTTVGTAHFVSRDKAASYYRDQAAGNDGFAIVAEKEVAGEIHIGPPKLKRGQKLLLIDGGRRYAIQDTARESAQDKIVERAYYASCSGVQINILDIPKVFAFGRLKIEAGEDFETLKASLRAYVDTLAK